MKRREFLSLQALKKEEIAQGADRLHVRARVSQVVEKRWPGRQKRT
jgi:hypothetical protein